MTKNKVSEQEKLAMQILAAKSFNEFWRDAQKILKSLPCWETVMAFYQKGPKTRAAGMINNFIAVELDMISSDKRVEKKEITFFGKKLNQALAKNDLEILIPSIFSIVLKHLAKNKNLRLPKKISDADLKGILQELSSFPMFGPFFILNSIDAKHYNHLEKDEQDRLLALLFGLWNDLEIMMTIESLLKYKNPKIAKRFDDFVDTKHPVEAKYCELIKSKSNKKTFKNSLLELIKEDPIFFDTYTELVTLYEEENDYYLSHSTLYDGAEKALAVIVDKHGDWPQHLKWEYVKNRHIINIFDSFASCLWDDGWKEYAKDVYCKLLKSDSADNIGAKYNILAINLGYGLDEMNGKFKDQKTGLIDEQKREKWFEKYPSDFNENCSWRFEIE